MQVDRFCPKCGKEQTNSGQPSPPSTHSPAQNLGAPGPATTLQPNVPTSRASPHIKPEAQTAPSPSAQTTAQNRGIPAVTAPQPGGPAPQPVHFSGTPMPMQMQPWPMQPPMIGMQGPPPGFFAYGFNFGSTHDGVEDRFSSDDIKLDNYISEALVNGFVLLFEIGCRVLITLSLDGWTWWHIILGIEVLAALYFGARKQYLPGCLYNRIHVMRTGRVFLKRFRSKSGKFSTWKMLRHRDVTVFTG
eukprot:1379228-Rhodomonas_salina.1